MQTVVHHSVYDSYGFNAKIDLDKDNLVFFSVPYDDGWSAKVNGQDAEIEKGGLRLLWLFFVLRVQNDIQFTYETKGSFLGQGNNSRWLRLAYRLPWRSEIYRQKEKKEEAQPVEKERINLKGRI